MTDLRLFAAIAEEGTLSRGARRAFLTPPAASARVRALEAGLGVALLYRGNRGVALTGAGERFLHHARLILRQLDYLRDDVAGDADRAGHLRVYANTTAVTEFLPELLASFLAARPGATVDVQERLTGDILRGVREGSADLGIVSGEVAQAGLEAVPFSTDRLVMAVPEDHPLAPRGRVRFAETLAFAHIGLHEGSTLLAFLQHQMERNGYERALRTQVRSFEAMCRMVESGVGVGVVPESAARRHARTMRLRFVGIDEDWALRTRYVMMRESASLPRLGRALIDELVRTGAGGIAA